MSSSPIKPTFREDKVYEIRNYLSDWLRSYEADLIKTCLTCFHFVESVEGCKRFNNARPPARVIAYGCDQYFSPEEIPF